MKIPEKKDKTRISKQQVTYRLFTNLDIKVLSNQGRNWIFMRWFLGKKSDKDRRGICSSVQGKQ